MDTIFNYQALEKQNWQPEPLCCDEKYPRYLNNTEARIWYKSEKIWNCDLPQIKKSWLSSLMESAKKIKLVSAKKTSQKRNLQFFQQKDMRV